MGKRTVYKFKGGQKEGKRVGEEESESERMRQRNSIAEIGDAVDTGEVQIQPWETERSEWRNQPRGAMRETQRWQCGGMCV